MARSPDGGPENTSNPCPRPPSGPAGQPVVNAAVSHPWAEKDSARVVNDSARA